ncbi:ROK family protein [Actinoalloteichus spitiensis]|uniref:ROK family protein n=1 Tax=Actinoalloteichus spitiensis TaxID=252394 RepID=UPI0006925FA6|nr:ROK family protein [Actinoalloteichus spitiensis]
MRPRSSRDIRRVNRFDLLRRVYSAEHPVTRQWLVTATGLSPATVATLTTELLALGVLVEAGREDSGGGRPRARLAVNGDHGVLVGVDVAETYVRADLFDLALRGLDSGRREIGPEDHQPDVVAAHVIGLVRGMFGRRRLTRDRLLGIGVSLPGQRHTDSGVSLFPAAVGAYEDGDPEGRFRGLLADAFGRAPFLENPLKASTVAELWFGGGRAAHDLAVVTLGTGVGVGIAVDQRLYRGATDAAGEWGHTLLVPGGRPCRCGGTGCVEAYVGAPGIMATLRERDPGGPLLHAEESATVEALAAAAGRDDPRALAVLDEVGTTLGAALATLVNILNPDTVVLGSWVAARLGRWLLPAARAGAATHALPRNLAAVDWRLSGVEGHAVSLGVAALALEGLVAGGPAAAPRPDPVPTTAHRER